MQEDELICPYIVYMSREEVAKYDVEDCIVICLANEKPLPPVSEYEEAVADIYLTLNVDEDPWDFKMPPDEPEVENRQRLADFFSKYLDKAKAIVINCESGIGLSYSMAIGLNWMFKEKYKEKVPMYRYSDNSYIPEDGETRTTQAPHVIAFGVGHIALGNAKESAVLQFLSNE